MSKYLLSSQQLGEGEEEEEEVGGFGRGKEEGTEKRER